MYGVGTLTTRPSLQGADGQESVFLEALGTTSHRDDVSTQLWAKGSVGEWQAQRVLVKMSSSALVPSDGIFLNPLL